MTVSCSRAPILPASTAARTAAKEGSNRRLKPNMTGVEMESRSVLAASTSAMSKAMGFSHRTALPAFAAARRCGMCSGVGEPMMTASTCGSAKASSASLADRAPSYCDASFSAASPTGSQTRARSACGCPAMVLAWT